MKECFYRVTVTKRNREHTQYWYKKKYTSIIKAVEDLYKTGVDAVELEMITEKEYKKHNEKRN